MKLNKKLIGIVLISLLLSSCSTSTKHNVSEQVVEPLEKPYVAIISKGWQHQFWQSVKMGAFKAAKELNIELTFEGPEGDFAVDKQLDMLAMQGKSAFCVMIILVERALIEEMAFQREWKSSIRTSLW